MAIYSDFNTKASSGFIINEAAVYQAITNIISTRKTERLFLPEFGWEVDEILFEIIDVKTSRLILHELVEVIERWDPRVVVAWDNTSVTPNHDTNSYDIVVSFSIMGLSSEIFKFTGNLSGANQ